MSGPPIFAYIDQFLSGGVEPATPHLVLVWAVVIGGVAVGVGIIWEAKRSGHLWTIPTALVFVGIVVEAAATVILFEFDEGISHNQQSKIIALETRLAPRSIEGHETELIAKLKPFAGVEFDAATNIQDNEQALLLASLMAVLRKADWKQIDWKYAGGGISYNFGAGVGSPSIGTVATYDVEIQVRQEAPEQLKPAAEALARALITSGIPAHDSVVDATSVNNANVLAIHLIVGQKR